MNSSIQAQSADEAAPDLRRWIALVVLLVAAFMNLIDVTIVNVALPRLQTGFGASESQIEWIVAGFVLAFAMGLMPFGRLGDIIGRRIIFIIGVGAFTTMSAMCGLAPTIETLVIARIMQGIAGAMMMPQVMAIMQDIFPPHERGRAFAFFGLASSLAAVTGPVFGGYLISLDLFGLDWRPIFLINIPIGITAVIIASSVLPRIKGNPELTNDWVGILIASASLLLLLFPLIEGRAFGWPLWAFVMMAMSVPGFISFFVWQKIQERAQKSQLLPLSLWRNRNYLVGTFTTMIFFAGMPGLFMVLALFLQSGFGLTPLESGLATSPFPIGIFLASALAGRLGGHYKKQRLIFGIALLLAGMIWVRQTILGSIGSVGADMFIGPLFLAGLGMGTAIGVLFQTILSGIAPGDAGSGSGGLQAFQQIGGAIGIALIGQIFFATLYFGGEPTQEMYIHAAGTAMILNIAAFATVVVLALFLNTEADGPVGRKVQV